MIVIHTPLVVEGLRTINHAEGIVCTPVIVEGLKTINHAEGIVRP